MIALRIATTNDADAIAKIYSYYVNNTAITFEYIAPDKQEFAKRITDKLQKYPFIVAVDSGTVIGYAYASEYRTRTAYGWDAELSVYIDYRHTGKGAGKLLYSALIEILKHQNIVTLCAGITYPNEASEALHRGSGFEYIGTFRTIGFKNGKWHDVMWYEKQINTLGTPSKIVPFSLLDKDITNRILKLYSR